MLYDLHCTIYTLSALYFILIYSTLYDICPILPNSMLYALYCILKTLYYICYIIYSTLNTIIYILILYDIHCTIWSNA